MCGCLRDRWCFGSLRGHESPFAVERSLHVCLVIYYFGEARGVRGSLPAPGRLLSVRARGWVPLESRPPRAPEPRAARGHPVLRLLRPRPSGREARSASPRPPANPRWIRRSDSFVCQGRRRSKGGGMAELYLAEGSTKPRSGLAGLRSFPGAGPQAGVGLLQASVSGPGCGLGQGEASLAPEPGGGAGLGSRACLPRRAPTPRGPLLGARRPALGRRPGPRGGPAG